jgi:hypothetical protein
LHPLSCRPMLKRSRDHTRGLGTLHGWETIEWHAYAAEAHAKSLNVTSPNDFRNQTLPIGPPPHPILVLWQFLFLIHTYPNQFDEARDHLVAFINNLSTSQPAFAYLETLNNHIGRMGMDFNDKLANTDFIGYNEPIKTCLDDYDGIRGSNQRFMKSSFERESFLIAWILVMLRITVGFQVGRPRFSANNLIFDTDHHDSDHHITVRTTVHYESILAKLRGFARPKLPFNALDCNTFSNVAQGPNSTCYLAAVMNIMMNSPTFMRLTEERARRGQQVDASTLWKTFKELRATGGGLASVLGPQANIGVVPADGHWSQTELGRLVARIAVRGSDEQPNSLDGGTTADFFNVVLKEVLDIETGRAHTTNGFAYPIWPVYKAASYREYADPVEFTYDYEPDPVLDAEPEAIDKTVVLMVNYNHTQYEDNLYIAQTAPRNEFIGVLLGMDGHTVVEMPCGVEGSGSTTICNSNQYGSQGIPVLTMEYSTLIQYRNRADLGTEYLIAPSPFVWVFSAPPTNPVYYILELKNTFDFEADTFPDIHPTIAPCRKLGDPFFYDVPESLGSFLWSSPNVLNLLMNSALRYLSCMLTSAIETLCVLPVAQALPRYEALDRHYRVWLESVERTLPVSIAGRVADFTASTLDLVAQVSNSFPPLHTFSPEFLLPTIHDVTEHVFDLFEGWGWRKDAAPRVRRWYAFHATPLPRNVSVRTYGGETTMDTIDVDREEYEQKLAVLFSNPGNYFEDVLTFMSTMGNRLRTNTITTAQYHPWWIQMLWGRSMLQFEERERGEVLEIFITKICKNFPTQILGASEVVTLALILYPRSQLQQFTTDWVDIRRRNKHHKTPGWFVFDSYARGGRHGSLWKLVQKAEDILNSATVGMAPDLTLDSGIEGKPRSWLYAYSYPCRRVWPGY